jgi:sodium/bile acid cotransporter 7
MDREEEDEDLARQYFTVKESLDAMNGVSSSEEKTHHTKDEADDEPTEPVSCLESLKRRVIHICENESLLVMVSIAILLAYIYPRLGAEFLFPEVTAHWIAVILIFFLSGFALKLHELGSAASNMKFNVFVVIYNFLGISVVVNFVAKFFYQNEIVSESLMKGMIICSCLSMPTNMMIVLTIASKGDEAVALFLATTMNLLGVFITPLLIFFYLGENSEIDFVNTYKTISLRVLVPVAAGLAMRTKLPGADTFADECKVLFHKIRERALVYVVYATFCKTFMEKSDSTGSQILIMAISQVILLVASMIIAWISLFIFFNRRPKLRVCGLFGCSTKTAALGIPLISAIYEDHPKLGIFTLPLLIWYPAQLIIGTALSSRLSRFVDYKLHKYEIERQRREWKPKGCGLLEQPSWA